MTRLIQRARSHYRDLVLRSSTRHDPRSFSAEAVVIDLDLSPQHIVPIPFAYDLENLVVQHQAVS